MNKRHFSLLITIAALSLQGCVSFPYRPTKFSVKLVEGDNDPYVGELVRFESGFQGTTFEVVGDGFLPYDDAFLAVEPGETQIIAHYKEESQSFDFTISEVTDPALILELPTGLQVATSDTFRVSGIGDDEEVELRFLEGRNLVSYEGRTIEGLADGLVNAVAVQGEKLSVPTEMEVGPYSVTPKSLQISFNGTLLVGESAKLKTEVHPWGEHYDLSYEVLSGSDFVGVEDDGTLVGLAEGKALVRAKVGKLYSNEVTVEVREGVDPYEGMDAFDFYLNYEPAESYLDSFYRSRHGFMSGDIEPTRSGEHPVNANRPMEGDQYVRNSSAIYEDGGMTYTVLDENGDKAYSVYYGGGYITAEEVAAYIYAFGETPGNYIDNKQPNSQEDEEQWELWDKYLMPRGPGAAPTITRSTSGAFPTTPGPGGGSTAGPSASSIPVTGAAASSKILRKGTSSIPTTTTTTSRNSSITREAGVCVSVTSPAAGPMTRRPITIPRPIRRPS